MSLRDAFLYVSFSLSDAISVDEERINETKSMEKRKTLYVFFISCFSVCCDINIELSSYFNYIAKLVTIVCLFIFFYIV